jgi:type I restriction enzyme S subunit
MNRPDRRNLNLDYPEDWNISRIGEISLFVNRGKSPVYTEHSNYKVINQACIYWEGLKLENTKFVTKAFMNSCPTNKQLQFGDIIINSTGTGTLGRIGYYNLPYSLAFDSHVTLVRLKEGFIPKFFYYFFSSKPFQDNLEIFCVTGSTNQIELSKSALEELYVCFPGKQEQKRIAEILTTVDNTIEKTEQLIEKYKNIKTGIMQDLFTRGLTEDGKLRPKYEEAPELYKPSDLGMIPKEWEVKELRELFDFVYGDSPKYITDPYGQYEIWGTGGISGYGKSFHYDGESILIGRKGTIDKPLYLNGKFWVIDTAFYAKNFKDCDVKWLYYYLTTIDFKIYNEATGVPSLSRATIEKIKVKIPKLNEQLEIRTRIQIVDNNISKELIYLEKLKKLKQGLMQDLLTGKVRVKVDNIEEVKEVTVEKEEKKVPTAFLRAVLAAEITAQLKDEPTFGSVKQEKILYLCENLTHRDLKRKYYRQAAGPYDPGTKRSIEKILKDNKWFETKREKGKRTEYLPLKNCGGHKDYFEKHFSSEKDKIQEIIDLFKTAKTVQCEIVATLYAAWNDFLIENKTFTDNDIIDEVLNNWHEDKERISRDRWQKALDWMREKDLVPEGVGAKTLVSQ